MIFHQDHDAEKASATVAKLRERLRVKPEFKFSKCSDDIRTQFFAFLSDHQFKVRALAVEEARIYSAHLRSGTGKFLQLLPSEFDATQRGCDQRRER